ncbi:autotransporter assembly complex protein TamA [Parasphingorhabdus cellanae]|uniref:BamA/TamA family outer membrane protein n=1 Tax=Parasphingorhabdus cellanae TaxID=2806553 RepID=A0ABX7T1X2_9SPHN|nr:BamA/TamA family outer membrane protein [Parasphingorhabdus cellanae]QTD54524.1 BamA/TamA family outer membrane protein [Parasphingorhabdus cellanae]
MGLIAYRYRLLMLRFVIVFAAFSLNTAQPLLARNIAQNIDSESAADQLDQAISGDMDTVQEPLDPDQPLTDFPDFGVDWPDLNAPSPDNKEPQDPAEATERDLEMDRRLAEDDSTQSEDGALRREPGQQEVGQRQVGTRLQDGGFVNFQPLDAMAERAYEISFSGLPDNLGSQFSERFQSLSALEEYKDAEANFAQIKRRAETDRELVERLLRIEGYYDAIVRNRFAAGQGTDIAVTIAVTAGPQYRLDTIVLDGIDQAQEDDPQQFREQFGLQSGDVVNSDAIADARTRLDQAMAENGYPFAATDQPALVIDHAERQGDLDIVVTPGEKYVFGSILMTNTELFGPEHAELIARFDEGDLYKQSDIEDLRRALVATGLVSTAALQPVASEEKPGVVDISATVTPAPLRTISGALGYGTGEGLRSEINWEHRNFFPPEGLIRLTGVLATQEQSGSITYRRNNFRRRDNVLNGQVALSNIDNSAFEARTFSVSGSLERQSNLIFQKKWNWSAGFELLASQERDIDGDNQTTSRDTFFIGALPATLSYDASDDLLDPTTGFRLSARLSPEASLQSGSFFYVRSQLDGSAYFPVSEKIVLAGRARFGSIVGAGSNRIAPSRRLYSGGGGSVRGYGFQRIGPRDVNNDPAGGRSLVEFSLEARVRLDIFGGNFGVVPFIDAGNVYTESLPDFSGIRYGTGLGIRYYSAFGPIRVDVGTPINPQPGDSRIAVYVSLGQAF